MQQFQKPHHGRARRLTLHKKAGAQLPGICTCRGISAATIAPVLCLLRDACLLCLELLQQKLASLAPKRANARRCCVLIFDAKIVLNPPNGP
jgi:hypothetical protein